MVVQEMVVRLRVQLSGTDDTHRLAERNPGVRQVGNGFLFAHHCCALWSTESQVVSAVSYLEVLAVVFLTAQICSRNMKS